MMMMIGQLNASHTGVSGGPRSASRTLQTRYPGFDLVADASGFYKVGHIYKDGPADHDYLKIKEGQLRRRGRRSRSEDERQLLAVLHARARDEVPLRCSTTSRSKDGAWDVTITPVDATPPSATCSMRGGSTTAARSVTKLSNGEIGYLHIRAMDAPSLRQFQLDLAANRTKKALVIDQRFNGGGGIDQELLGILAGRQYQYTLGRDAGVPAAAAAELLRPDGRDAERALGVGRRDVPRRLQGARPRQGRSACRRWARSSGRGRHTLLDGSTIRTPGSGVWTSTGQNMENYGVPPDVYVDNTPEDFVKRRDAQLEKAVEVLKSELATRRPTTSVDESLVDQRSASFASHARLLLEDWAIATAMRPIEAQLLRWASDRKYDLQLGGGAAEAGECPLEYTDLRLADKHAEFHGSHYRSHSEGSRAATSP
mgnify:CR=1 FL=1